MKENDCNETIWVDGPNSIKEGPNSIKDGPNRIIDGPSSIKEGPNSIKDGPNSVKEGPNSIKDGPNSIKDGPNSVKDGPNSIKDGVGWAHLGPFLLRHKRRSSFWTRQEGNLIDRPLQSVHRRATTTIEFNHDEHTAKSREAKRENELRNKAWKRTKNIGGEMWKTCSFGSWRLVTLPVSRETHLNSEGN